MVHASPQMPIAELRRLLARTHSNGIYEGQALPFGIDAIDAVLPGGGLALGAVHEITEQGSDGARASLSALFVAGILARLPASRGRSRCLSDVLQRP
jgi:protein ImuA